MAKSKKEDKNQGIDLLENPEIIADKAEEFFNNKRNQNILYGVVLAVALVVGGVAFLRYQNNSNNEEAQQEMFQAIYYFETDSLGKALNGDGNNYGFLDIIDEYSGTKASNIASFYAGTSFLKLGDYENAIEYLKEFGSSDYLLQARAYSLIADAFMELDEFEEAISYYSKAVSYKPNKEFTPIYLKKLAIAQEESGSLKEAAAAYKKITEDFPNSKLEQEARKQSARLEGLTVE